MHIIRSILGSALFVALAIVLAPIAWLGYLAHKAVIYLSDHLLDGVFSDGR